MTPSPDNLRAPSGSPQPSEPEPSAEPSHQDANKWCHANWTEGFKIAGADSNYVAFWAFVAGCEYASDQTATARAALAQCEEKLAKAEKAASDLHDDIREKLAEEIIECVRYDEDPSDEIGSKLLYFERAVTARYLTRLEKSEAYIKKLDGIIEEVGGVTASCINPYEDLKLAMLKLKADREALTARLASANEHATASAKKSAELFEACSSLRDQLASATQDSKRMDWLDRRAAWHDPESRVTIRFPMETVSFRDLRAAIDAAMSATHSAQPTVGPKEQGAED